MLTIPITPASQLRRRARQSRLHAFAADSRLLCTSGVCSWPEVACRGIGLRDVCFLAPRISGYDPKPMVDAPSRFRKTLVQVQAGEMARRFQSILIMTTDNETQLPEG